MGAGNLNFGVHVCGPNTLPMDSSTHPKQKLLNLVLKFILRCLFNDFQPSLTILYVVRLILHANSGIINSLCVYAIFDY